MPAKWQQWMPFKIDAFKSSPSVRAMHPAARAGYLYLLTFQWQTEDCTIPSDPIELAEISELGDELWTVHGARILRKFDTVTVGNSTVTVEKLRNLSCFEEWSKARQVFKARQESAKKTTKIRSPRQKSTVTVGNSNGHRAVTEGGPSRSADTHTRTYTDTETENTKKQIPLPQDKPAVVKKVDPRFSLFRKDFETHYQRLNNILPPKDGKEAGNLSRWLKANPTVTQEQWRQILRNRRNSPLNHAAPLSRWIGNALAWLNHPADEFGKPITGANGNGKRAYTTTGEHNRAALYEALGYRDSDHGSIGPDGDREGWEGEPGIPEGDSGPIIEGTVG